MDSRSPSTGRPVVAPGAGAAAVGVPADTPGARPGATTAARGGCGVPCESSTMTNGGESPVSAGSGCSLVDTSSKAATPVSVMLARDVEATGVLTVEATVGAGGMDGGGAEVSGSSTEGGGGGTGYGVDGNGGGGEGARVETDGNEGGGTEVSGSAIATESTGALNGVVRDVVGAARTMIDFTRGQEGGMVVRGGDNGRGAYRETGRKGAVTVIITLLLGGGPRTIGNGMPPRDWPAGG